MKYLRMYAGADGKSHFAEVDADLQPVEFVPGRPLVDLSSPTPAAATAIAHLPAGWVGDYHPSPRRQLVIPVRGELIVTASDGETRRIAAGTIWLLEDTSGKGHLRLPGGWASGGYYNPPRRNFFITLSGELEIETSDGEVRQLGPGAIWLAEDTDGRGHITRNRGGEWLGLLVTPAR